MPAPIPSITRISIYLHIYIIIYLNYRPPSLQSTPLPFQAIFNQYFQLGQRIRKHYLSPRVLFCLLTGKLVPPLDRKNLYSLQYSMLPAKRVGIGEVWTALNAMPLPAPPKNVPSLRTVVGGLGVVSSGKHGGGGGGGGRRTSRIHGARR